LLRVHRRQYLADCVEDICVGLYRQSGRKARHERVRVIRPTARPITVASPRGPLVVSCVEDLAAHSRLALQERIRVREVDAEGPTPAVGPVQVADGRERSFVVFI
jgi:hypothetical protein